MVLQDQNVDKYHTCNESSFNKNKSTIKAQFLMYFYKLNYSLATCKSLPSPRVYHNWHSMTLKWPIKLSILCFPWHSISNEDCILFSLAWDLWSPCFVIFVSVSTLHCVFLLLFWLYPDTQDEEQCQDWVATRSVRAEFAGGISFQRGI